jgi:hypothetical protein
MEFLDYWDIIAPQEGPFYIILDTSLLHKLGDCGITVVKLMRFKSEGHWFDPLTSGQWLQSGFLHVEVVSFSTKWINLWY